MSTFENVLAKRDRTPKRHVILKANAFADDWHERPLDDGELALGLRKISDADTQTARAEAAKFAIEMHDDREGQIEAFNDALMRWLVVRGTCDPNDVIMNAPIFQGSEDIVRQALTSKSIRYVWDEIERFHLEMSPLVYAASDEDFIVFASVMQRIDTLEHMTPGQALRVRKLVGFCLSEMQDVLSKIEPNASE